MNAVPPAARAFLAGLFADAPPDDPQAALALAATRARAQACVVLALGVQPAAEVRELASLHAAIALQSVRHGRPMAPTVLLSAGPVLRGGAAGGAADFVLALALSLDEHPAIHGCACGPPPEPGAAPGGGFLLAPDTVRRALALGTQPGARLQAGEAAALLDELGDGYAVAPAPRQVLRALYIGVD
jgi:hydroxypyruvate reductase